METYEQAIHGVRDIENAMARFGPATKTYELLALARAEAIRWIAELGARLGIGEEREES